MTTTIIHAFFLALGLILPLGVQNVFVFNQGATQPKMARALPAVLTAAICDTLLISLAIVGVSILVFGVYWIKLTITSIGIVFLLYMGYTVWKTTPAKNTAELNPMSPLKQIMFGASVSLLNPHAILDTIGVIGTSSLAYSGAHKWVFAVTCIFVSWLWFFSLAFAGRQAGALDKTGKLLYRINKISAIIMWGTAIYLIKLFFN